MKVWKKALAFCMSVIAAVSFMACGGKKSDENPSSQTSEAPAKQSYYGVTLEFHVSPKDGEEGAYFSGYTRAALQEMLVKLQSDEFAELLFVPEVPETLEESEEVGYGGLTAEERAEIDATIALYKESVSYSYQNKKDAVDGSLMHAYFYAEIAVLKDVEGSREKAEFISQQILGTLPYYVRYNMKKAQGYNGTDCRCVSEQTEIIEFEK